MLCRGAVAAVRCAARVPLHTSPAMSVRQARSVRPRVRHSAASQAHVQHARRRRWACTGRAVSWADVSSLCPHQLAAATVRQQTATQQRMRRWHPQHRAAQGAELGGHGGLHRAGAACARSCPRLQLGGTCPPPPAPALAALRSAAAAWHGRAAATRPGSALWHPPVRVSSPALQVGTPFPPFACGGAATPTATQGPRSRTRPRACLTRWPGTAPGCCLPSRTHLGASRTRSHR